MLSVNDYCKMQFGEKVYKISLNAGMTCPNRDGTLDTRGCIFCSEGGSGEFASNCHLSMDEQIEEAKQRISKKYQGNKFIAYFQAYTNTYAPVSVLKNLFMSVILREDIVAISIATRPDCFSDEIYALLKELNKMKPVWVELGLQTIHKYSISYIRRGYDNDVYEDCLKRLNDMGIHTITHLILGLPFESKEDMINSVRYVIAQGTRGIKLQLLHVLKNTDLAIEYENGKFDVLEFDEYVQIISEVIKFIPDHVVVHRLTGDGPKKLLIAPLWSADKKRVLNVINKVIY